MCGILGSINTSFDKSILDLIKHRGPDDFGMEEFIVNSNKVQFGHRRLSIIDLSPAGHQPFHSSCKNYSIIFNGEIYNHQELRLKLQKNINYRGHSDTETILYYLKEFGIKGIKDFNGIFAIAFFDKINEKLYLARDPFGVKPLYYYESENTLIFSSEIRPIKAMLQNTPINMEAMSSLLRLRYNPAPDTIYKGIKKIRPGHFIEIKLTRDNISVKSNSFIDKIPTFINRKTKNVINEYGEKIEGAVKRQLLADVEIGILLSGGIDSALIAALAQKHYNGKLKSFTVGFDGNYSEDEIENAAETAQILGLEHHFKKISFIDFLNIIKESTRIVEEPLATTSLIPMYYLAELAAKHVKVVLTGQGADEPLGGYTKYKSELVRNKIPILLRNQIQNIVQLLKIKNEKILRGTSALIIKNEIERFLAIYEVFNLEEIQKLISVSDTLSLQRISYFYDLLDCKSNHDSVGRMMALDTRLSLSDDLLNYTDKITMNFSLECRVPMLDIELVKFIESLPTKTKLNLIDGKIIHKQYAAKILPNKIISRKKKGFQSPTIHWFREESGIIKDILLKKGTYFSKIFNQNYIAEIMEQHKKGYNKEKQIFLLLSIYFTLDSLDEIN